jgi:hypothetical protein
MGRRHTKWRHLSAYVCGRRLPRFSLFRHCEAAKRLWQSSGTRVRGSPTPSSLRTTDRCRCRRGMEPHTRVIAKPRSGCGNLPGPGSGAGSATVAIFRDHRPDGLGVWDRRLPRPCGPRRDGKGRRLPWVSRYGHCARRTGAGGNLGKTRGSLRPRLACVRRSSASWLAGFTGLPGLSTTWPRPGDDTY